MCEWFSPLSLMLGYFYAKWRFWFSLRFRTQSSLLMMMMAAGFDLDEKESFLDDKTLLG